MKISLLPGILLFPFFLLAQKSLFPTVGSIPDFSQEAWMEFERCDEILQKIVLGSLSYEQLSPNDRHIVEKYESIESLYDVLPAGCSWYCGGGPSLVTASSELPAYKGITYEAGNAHDLSLSTAWVEGVPGYGIGQYLEYVFEPQSPRVTTILLYNGYVKSEKAWLENSRVKQLLLSINHTPYAILELADTRARQEFKIGTVGRNPFGLETVLRFEILDIYPGDKYEDTAISEIYFDGLDVHCFAPDTQILMANGEQKAIQEIAPGEEVITIHPQTGAAAAGTVSNVQRAIHSHLIRLHFENGNSILSTPDHPYLLQHKGWCSLEPGKSRQYEGMEQIGLLQQGDYFLQADKQAVKLIHIEKIHQKILTYSLELANGDTFVANGLVVATERLTDAN